MSATGTMLVTVVYTGIVSFVPYGDGYAVQQCSEKMMIPHGANCPPAVWEP
jgi:hypothetical protein